MTQENNDTDVNSAYLYRPGTGLMFTGPGDPNKPVFTEKVINKVVEKWKKWRQNHRRKRG